MEDQFLYFLGAGASCNALPLVKDFTQRLRQFQTQLKTPAVNYMDSLSKDEIWSKLFKTFNDDLKWLINESGKHASIDTYAKKLYLKRDTNNLKKLKSILSCYLIFEQARKNVDYRYDSFFASILEKKEGEVTIPSDVKILTWNYDTQLEKAFFGFCEDFKKVLEQITNNQNILRLNGICATKYPNKIGEEFKSTFINGEFNIYEEFLKMHGQCTDPRMSLTPSINFAWEIDIIKNKAKLKAMLSSITILIIIGYSFPFFNREIDRIILNALPNLKKIYVQVPSDFHNSIEDRLLSLRNDLPPQKYLHDINLFYIPFEYQ